MGQKIASFLLCSKKKAVIDPDREPDISEGLGAGKTVNEIVRDRKMKKHRSIHGGIADLMTDENLAPVDNSLFEAANKIRKKQGKDVKKVSADKQVSYKLIGEYMETASDKEDDDWINQPFRAEDKEPKAVRNSPKEEEKEAEGEEGMPPAKTQAKPDYNLVLEDSDVDDAESYAAKIKKNESVKSKTNSGGRPSDTGSSNRRILHPKDDRKYEEIDEDFEVKDEIGEIPISVDPEKKHSNLSGESDADYIELMKMRDEPL